MSTMGDPCRECDEPCPDNNCTGCGWDFCTDCMEWYEDDPDKEQGHYCWRCAEYLERPE